MKEPLIVSHDPAKFSGHWHCGCGDIMCSEGHVIYGQEPLKVSHNPAKFGGHRHFVSENIIVLVFFHDLAKQGKLTTHQDWCPWPIW